METWKKYAAELYGTFVLVGLGTAGVIAVVMGTGRAIDIAFAFGLALIVALFTVGHISGGHFNPVVSLGMYLDRRLSLSDLIAYWAAQAAGAVLASLALAAIISRAAVERTITTVNEQVISVAAGIAVEAALTAVFVLVILVVTKRGLPGAYWAIGMTLAVVHLAGIALTGASVNPARSFAPALVSGEWRHIEVYLAGPVLGAAIAWVLFSIFDTSDRDSVS